MLGGIQLAVAVLPMDLPLYLYQSRLNDDFALLTAPPQAGSVINTESYVLWDKHPVGFAASAPFVSSGGNSSALYAYWSASRRDIQTTTWSLAQLNAHGGDYVPLSSSDISGSGAFGFAYLAAAATPHYEEGTPLTPLRLVYSDARSDAASSPLNGADINAIIGAEAIATSADVGTATSRTVPVAPFRTTGMVLGYARQGSCARCSVGLSESFPSAGGADCAKACNTASGERCGTRIYHYGRGTMAASMAGQAMAASMAAAGDVLRGLDASVRPESGSGLHVSFLYNCCYKPEQLDTIQRVLDSLAWVPQNVTFDRAAWRIDNAGNPPDHYSICVFLDKESNQRMLAWVASVEAAIEAAGVPIHIPRSVQEPFHSTLCVVNGSTFPVEEGARRVNELIAPGTWTGAEPLTLLKAD